MESFLNRLNLVLLVLVGALCAHQWSGEKAADGRIIELRRAARADEDHIASQELAIRGAREDLADFKSAVTELKRKSDSGDAQIRQDKARIFTLELEEKHGAAQADVWNKTLAAYKQAVAQRDDNIHLLLDQRRQLADADKEAAGKANRAILAYNDLAARYTALVDHYNELAKRYKALTTPPADGRQENPKS
jgi:chromosome segregation ATPase